MRTVHLVAIGCMVASLGCDQLLGIKDPGVEGDDDDDIGDDDDDDDDDDDVTPPVDGGDDIDAALERDGGPEIDGSSTQPDSGSSTFSCADPTTIFCEDFEALAPGTATSDDWTANPSGGSTLTIDSQHARDGHGQALHVRTQNGGFGRMIVPFAPPGNSAFGRMYLYMTEFPSAPNFSHFTLVEATGTGSDQIRPIGGQYVGSEGASLWGIGADGGSTGDWTDWQPSAPAVAGQWLCMEFELYDPENRIQVWIDGVLQDDMTVDTTNHGGGGGDFLFPTFDEIWFGWWNYQGGTTPTQFDVWIDDVALSTTQIGC